MFFTSCLKLSLPAHSTAFPNCLPILLSVTDLSLTLIDKIVFTGCQQLFSFSECWSSGGPPSLKKTICKGREEHGGGRIIQMVICNNPCSSVPLILVIFRTVLFANDHLQKNGGGRILRMIICNNSCSSVPLIGHPENSLLCK